jgi:anti-anti-sigma factor
MVEFKFEEATQTLFCTFEGRMDTVTSSAVTERFNAKFSEFKGKAETLHIVFNLKAVDYVASSFLRLSILASKGVPKGHFSIVNTDPLVLKVFTIAGLSKMLNVS